MRIPCAMKNADGSPCHVPAVHHWGPVNCCCEHFSRLVEGIYDLQKAVSERRHQDLVKHFEESSKHNSRIQGLMCLDSDKPKDEAK